MMKDKKPQLTLDQSVVYQLKVPGHLKQGLLENGGTLTLEIGYDEVKRPTTILTGTLDQAALIGLLRRLYSLGLPVISVEYVEGK